MTQHEIAPATPEDLEYVAANMDPADAAEVWATAHKTPIEALTLSAGVSRETWAGRADGRAVCIFGVGTRFALDTVGVPWLLGTPEIRQHKRLFLRASKVWVSDRARQYSVLENWVDSRHTRAVKWLRWLGFTIEDAQPYGPDGVPFHRFHMRA